MSSLDENFVTPVRSLDEIEPAPSQQAPQPPQSAQSQNGGLSPTPRSPEFHVLPEIDNTNRNFKGQQRNEVVHSFCRKHWIVLVPYFIGAIFFIGLPLVFLLFVPRDTILSLVSPLTYRIIAGLIFIGMTYYFHRLFLRFFNYYLQVLIITNFRVVQLDQTLFFNRNRDSIDIPEIQDMVIQQSGIFKTILNYGELTITLSSAHASKSLTCVPNPEYFFRKINKTKREYITSRRMAKGIEEKLPMTKFQ
ncbi:PH domain-containing protein [Candidatus Peregrinibacteria bacterium]|nr:PH domain-containing protein [Candidatus Peregrinibacteria bacterium]